jgi:hypothetical protein
MLLASTQVQAIGQNTLSATQDSYVHKNNSSTNFGDEEILLVKLSSSGSGDRQAYYQFDLSQLTDDVKSATFQVGIEETNTAQLSIYSSSESWSESSITWDSKLEDLSLVTDLPDDIDGKYLVTDIAALINSFRAAGKDDLTLIIDTGEQTSESLELASRESSTDGAQPKVSFEYSNADHGFTLGSQYVTAKDDPDDPYYNYAADYLVDVQGEASEINNYGGWLDWNLGATGFFRVEEVNGNWTAVDPDGYAYIVMALNTVVENDVLDLPSDIQAFGINAIGSWSDESIENISYTPRWNFISEFKNTDETLKDNYNTDGIRILPVFEPDFVTFADELAQGAAAYKDDPYVFGHFTDNEIPLHQEIQLNSSLTYLDSDDPQYVSADSWMKEKYGNNYDIDDITEADEHEYMGVVADKYYEVVSAALRKYDPNHMVLGTRLHAKAKYNEYVFEAAGKYTDVVSVNYYKNWEPELADAVAMWQEQAAIPFMITEFYTKAADSGLENSGGAGWQVLNQQGRSDFFENFALKLLSASHNIGWHWFKFNDDDGSNKGVYTEDFLLSYQELQDSMAQIASQVYPLRSVLLTGTPDFEGEASDVEETSSLVHFVKSNSTGYGIDGNNGGANSQNVYLWTTDSGNVNQQWIQIPRGDGYYSYQKNGTDYCLDGGNGGEDGRSIYLWTCSDTNENQHWEKITQSSGAVRFEKRNAPGYSIDGGDGGGKRQDVILGTSDDSDENQHWILNTL